ncbi:uncharacterized protein LOC144916785 isoform X2 [Branchiostoma floridae x Branchiostoma belcheri]
MIRLYILSVKWSEGSEFIIYRRYSAFFQLHQKLSELFPIETGAVSKKDQTIPPLPKQRWFGNEKFKVADERILTIDEYCRKVAMAEPKISEHEEVLNFFEALPEDLTPPPPDPKKPNKTYLTFESKSGGNKVKEKSGEDMEISAPILLETYRAIATFTPSGKTEVRLEEGAHVDVVEKNMSGWWLVQADDKQGWCPASYLEPLDQPEERDEERPNWEGEEFLTTEKYEPQIDDEIGFDKGVIVHVIHKLLDGWWIVRYNDKVGYAPCAYLQKYTNPHLPLHKARASTNSDTSTGSFIKRLPPRRSTIRKRSSAHGNESKQRDLQIYRRKTLEASKSKRSRLAAKAKEAYRRVSAVTEEPEEEGTYMDMAPDTVANTDKGGYIYPENTDAKTFADHAYVNDSVVEEIASRKRASSSDPRSTLTGTDVVTESCDVYVSDEEILAEGPEGYLLPNDTENTSADHPYVNENLVDEIAGRKAGPRSTGREYVNEDALAQGAASLGNTYVCVETQESAHRRKTNNSTDDVWAPAFVSAKPKGKAVETRNSNSANKSVWVPAFADKEGAYMDMDGDTVAKTDAQGYIQPDNTANLPDPYVNEIVVEEIASRKTSSSSAETRSSNSSTQSVWAPAFVDQEKSKKKFPKNPNYIDSNTVASMAGKNTKQNGQTRYLNLGYVPDAPVSSSAWNTGPNSHDNTVASTDSAYENIDVQQQNITKGTTTTRPERATRSPRTSRAPVPAPRGTTPTLLLPETGTEFKSNSGSSTPKSGRSTPKSGRSSPKNGRLSPSIPARPTAAEIAAKCSQQTKQRMLQPQQNPEDSVLSSPSGRSTPKDGHTVPKSPRSRPKSSNSSSPNAQRKGTIVEGLAAKFGKVLQRK